MLKSLLIDLIHAGCLVAQTRISSMNEAFREQSQIELGGVVIFLAIIVGAIVLGLTIYQWYNSNQERMKGDDPHLLFHELCAAYSIPWTQRRALCRLARMRKLSSPGVLFLDVRLWPTNGEAQRSLGGHTRRMLCELRRNLFQSLKAEQTT